jgi:hypothetical protein
MKQSEPSRVRTSYWHSLLETLSYVAQIVIAGVAVWGYFYTVRPVFQFQLLQEDNARLTRRNGELNDEYTATSSALEELRVERARLINENITLVKTSEELDVALRRAKLKITEKTKELFVLRKEARKIKYYAYRSIVLDNIPDIPTDIDVLWTSTFLVKNPSGWHAWPSEVTPYKIMSLSLSKTLENSSLPETDKRSLDYCIKNFLGENMHTLSKPSKMNSLLDEYDEIFHRVNFELTKARDAKQIFNLSDQTATNHGKLMSDAYSDALRDELTIEAAKIEKEYTDRYFTDIFSRLRLERDSLIQQINTALFMLEDYYVNRGECSTY